jgi:hypothetical protein
MIENNMIRKEINIILAKWNPLDVPDFIAEEEYIAYIEEIITIGKIPASLKDFLINIVTVKMGLVFDIRDESQNNELDNIVNDIIAILPEPVTFFV